MKLQTISHLALSVLLVACGGSSSSDDATAPAEVVGAGSTTTTKHDAFVCRSENPTRPDAVTMFAFDEQAFVDKTHTRPGFCFIALMSPGKPILSYFCDVGQTETAVTTDGQQALLFTQFLGDGLELLTQYNLLKDVREKKGGKRLMRTLSRSPKDLKQPIASNEDHVDCKLETVDFPR
jgi:hypothetical protein